MFCSRCGAENHAEAGYCHNCGASLSSVGTHKNSPRSAAASIQGHAIWNPNAAANWSLIFTPAFGSYLQMLNWKALGEPDKAASSKNWFYASLSILVIYVLIGVFMSDSKAADGAVRGLGFLYLLVWYFSTGRSQGKFVKEKFGLNYARNPWGKALLTGFTASIGYFIFFLLVAYIQGAAVTSQNKNETDLAAAAKSNPYGKFDTTELPAAPTPARAAQYNALQAQQDASPIAFTTMGSDQNLQVFFKDGTARTLQAGEPIPDNVAQFNARQAQLKALRNGAVASGVPPTNSVGDINSPNAIAIAELKKSPYLAPQFDSLYGPGAAQKVLGNMAKDDNEQQAINPISKNVTPDTTPDDRNNVALATTAGIDGAVQVIRGMQGTMAIPSAEGNGYNEVPQTIYDAGVAAGNPSTAVQNYNAQVNQGIIYGSNPNQAAPDAAAVAGQRAEAENQRAWALADQAQRIQALPQAHAQERAQMQYQTQSGVDGNSLPTGVSPSYFGTSGQHYQGVAGGIVNSTTGTFSQDVGAGFVNSQTGQFTPKP